jgi:GNAT superfamily N-acetyltransferase
MQLIEVKNRTDAKDFIQVNVLMNRSNPVYIRPLDNEVNEVFDPAKNKLFQYGQIVRWILKGDSGNLIGRIAAFTNEKYINKGTDYPTGGMGFFDCINDQQAADILLNAAKTWLQNKGMEAMDGPVNFGDRDKGWGLMVEGFDKEPMYGMAFNPPYYQQLIENYGFKNYYNQYYYGMRVDTPFQAKIAERHARFAHKKEYSALHADLRELEKYAGDFVTVYNAAWAQHGEAKETTREEIIKLFKTMKPVMDERLVWFAYYKEDPIAMFINIPDVNQYFKHFNGKFGLLQKLHLLWMKKMGYCKQATGLAFGVVPKFQALGIDSYIIHEVALFVQNKGWYDTYEMGWAGDWNPRMINIYKSLGGVQSRRMVTYRYIFDEQVHPFERHPEMEYK